MGLSFVVITLPDGKDFYFSGEILRGHLDFEIKPNVSYDYMAVSFTGEAFAMWSERKNVEKTRHRFTQPIISIDQKLTNNGEAFKEGFYSVPFSIALPSE